MTFLAEVIWSVHVSVDPEHAPLHPTNRAPAAGAAVSVTWVPRRYPSVQSEPHEIPLGDEVTVPRPFVLTPRRYLTRSKVAVTLRAWVIVTVHVDVPLQAPDHPANEEPGSGLAVSVTLVPDVKNTLQV